jgi:hypothetical protein
MRPSRHLAAWAAATAAAVLLPFAPVVAGARTLVHRDTYRLYATRSESAVARAGSARSRSAASIAARATSRWGSRPGGRPARVVALGAALTALLAVTVPGARRAGREEAPPA